MVLGNKKDQLRAENISVIKCHVVSAFTVHPDFKSHARGGMNMVKTVVKTILRKIKLNTKSSIESKMVGEDSASIMNVWNKIFIEAQGYKVDENIFYHNNQRNMLLELNGKEEL